MREKIIKIIEQILTKKQELKSLEMKIDSLEKKLDALLPDNNGIFAKKGDIIPERLPYKILQILNSEPKRIFKAQDFFHLGFEMSVRSTLSRLKKKGHISNPKWGRYKAPSPTEQPETAHPSE